MGTIIAFHGCKGGAGTTFLAAETVALLSAKGRRVAAVDVDLHRGCLHYRLDVPLTRDTFTVADLLPVFDDTTERAIENAFTRCRCGAFLLPAPQSPVLPDGLTTSRARGLATALSRAFDYVVLDTPPALDEATVGFVGSADLVVLVLTPELAGLGGAKRALDVMAERGLDGPSFCLVVNRSLGDADSVTLADTESFLGLPAAVILPEDTARCRRAGDEGMFVAAERSALSQGVQAMVKRILGATSVAARRQSE